MEYKSNFHDFIITNPSFSVKKNLQKIFFSHLAGQKADVDRPGRRKDSPCERSSQGESAYVMSGETVCRSFVSVHETLSVTVLV